jgi:hypothetical protein
MERKTGIQTYGEHRIWTVTGFLRELQKYKFINMSIKIASKGYCTRPATMATITK